MRELGRGLKGEGDATVDINRIAGEIPLELNKYFHEMLMDVTEAKLMSKIPGNDDEDISKARA